MVSLDEFRPRPQAAPDVPQLSQTSARKNGKPSISRMAQKIELVTQLFSGSGNCKWFCAVTESQGVIEATTNLLQAQQSLEKNAGIKSIIPMIDNTPIVAESMNLEGQCPSKCSKQCSLHKPVCTGEMIISTFH